MPIDIQLTAIPAPADAPLAEYFSAAGTAGDGEDIAVAVQDAGAAGLEPYLGGLTNTPSAAKTPAWLASEAVRVAAGSGLTARIREPGELAAEGFGGILAVGSGSTRPPRLIELGYQPPAWTGMWCWSARASRSTAAGSRSSRTSP